MSAVRLQSLVRNTIGVRQMRAFSAKVPTVTPAVSATTSEVTRMDAASGAPFEVAEQRSVRIYRPAKTAMQSGLNNTRKWKIDFDILPDGARWENPLMGWASSADALQALEMQFNSKDDAVSFAERQGWSYYVQEPKERALKPRVYADNFKYSADKLRMVHTK